MVGVVRRGVVVVAVLAGAVSAACSTSPAPSSSSPSADPAAAAVQQAVEEHLEQRGLDGMRALLVAVDGQLVLERYWDSGPDEHADTLSVTKTITGTLVGAALADGSLNGLDQTLAELLPDRADTMTPELASVTLEQLLTMTAGLPGDGSREPDWWSAQDWVGAILAEGTVTEPGTRFAYSNSSSHLLAAVLAEATGRSVLDYARQVLFDPLGIPTRPETTVVVTDDPDSARYDAARGFVWPQDPQGVNTGFGWAKLTARDLLALGQLYLDDGRADGRQVIPTEWVREATTPRVEVTTVPGMDAYGYQWWLTTADGHPAAVAWGFGGQLIEIVPDLAMVVVVSTPLADQPVFTTPNPLLNLVDTAIAPATTDPT
jgi:CubicO group peptidase (beta-lactamase class C family)